MIYDLRFTISRGRACRVENLRQLFGFHKQGGKALTVLNLDSAPSDSVLGEIKADKDIYDVKVAKL